MNRLIRDSLFFCVSGSSFGSPPPFVLVLLASPLPLSPPFLFLIYFSSSWSRATPRPCHSFIVLNHHYLYRDNVNGQGRAIANPTAVAGGSTNVSIESCTTACFNAGFGIAGTEYSEYVFKNFFFYQYTLYSTELNFVLSILHIHNSIGFPSRPSSIIKFYLVWGYSECCK